MTKIFTILTIFAISLTNAQIFTENFDDGVPGSMTHQTIDGNQSWEGCGANTGGVACPINGSGSATFYHTSSSGYNSALVTPLLNLNSGVYKVSYTLAKRANNGKINEFFLEISTDGGNTWSVINSQLEEIIDPTSYSFVLNPYYPTSETYLRFRAKNKGGYRLILDDIVVEEVTTDDIAITNFDISPIIIAGENEISGTLTNYGVNSITSFDLNWQVDGGEIYTENYNGQNITSGQFFNFTHSTAWNAPSGEHSVKVWVTNSNVVDSDSSNDEIIKEITVASNVAYKVPMYEKFSSSTCPPCYGYNTSYWNPFYLSYAYDKATYIAYQVNWPGAGDPYYTAEVGTRVNYYGINSAPSLLLNTENSLFYSSSQLENALNDAISEDNISYFNIDADHSIDGNIINISVDINPYISKNNVTLQVIVIEKTTYDNVANNGETEFHHVFMKGLPDTNGTPLNLQFDQNEHFTFSYDMSTTNVEEMEDLAVVVFLQDATTKEILQSSYTTASEIVLGMDKEIELPNVLIVPNPTSGILRLFTDKKIDVQIFDLSGRNIFSKSNVTNNTTLNLSTFGKGIYLVNIIDENGNKSFKKLIIN